MHTICLIKTRRLRGCRSPSPGVNVHSRNGFIPVKLVVVWKVRHERLVSEKSLECKWETRRESLSGEEATGLGSLGVNRLHWCVSFLGPL